MVVSKYRILKDKRRLTDRLCLLGNLKKGGFAGL
jgi:hypothetical protein